MTFLTITEGWVPIYSTATVDRLTRQPYSNIFKKNMDRTFPQKIQAPTVRHINSPGREPWDYGTCNENSRADTHNQRTNICRGIEQPIFKKADELFSNSNLQI